MLRRWTVSSVVALTLATFASIANAEEPDPPYDIYRAMRESVRYNNSRRQFRAEQQVSLQRYLQIYRLDAYRTRAYALPPRSARAAGVFEAWPTVPGDLWGFPPGKPVAQPAGRKEVQTSPRRWESLPVYR